MPSSTSKFLKIGLGSEFIICQNLSISSFFQALTACQMYLLPLFLTPLVLIIWWRRGESNSRPTWANHGGSTGLVSVRCRQVQIRNTLNPSKIFFIYHSAKIITKWGAAFHDTSGEPAAVSVLWCSWLNYAANAKLSSTFIFLSEVLRVVTDFPRPAPPDPPHAVETFRPLLLVVVIASDSSFNTSFGISFGQHITLIMNIFTLYEC